jgi:murein DD-endopeptidase MepM/ murein hydrolase activator NlpD
MRRGHVLAAELVNQGKAFHALWFDPNDDGKGTYYDLDGESVRRAFLRKPLEFRRISSRFSGGRFHPVLKRWRAHRGVDYAADTGTPVMVTGDGVVQRRENAGSCGNMVQVRHALGFVTRYCHLSRFARGVYVGSRVSQGEVIGYVGMTGLATGPHLHYEMIRRDRHVDPLAIELPGGDPVPTDSWSIRWRTYPRTPASQIPKTPTRSKSNAPGRPPLHRRIRSSRVGLASPTLPLRSHNPRAFRHQDVIGTRWTFRL